MKFPQLSADPNPPRAARGRRSYLASLLGLAIFAFLGGSSRAADASDVDGLKVVVHSSNPTHAVERSFLADAFLKKVTRWDDGEAIRPLDQRPDAAVRRVFSQKILNRTVIAVRSYWQQRIFSGRDVPPPELDSDASVIEYVERNPGAVGYVSSGAKLGNTRELQLR